jgi:cytochrome oxidase Cu insertion factor (SCO1/SenC/PrrC family)
MNRNKLKLTIILLAITVPISLATLLFQLSEGQHNLGTSSNGTLITPVLDVSELHLTDATGNPAFKTFEELTANVSPQDYDPRPWQLLYLGSANCDATCQERLYFIRQLHIRLAGEAKRVQRVYVLSAPAPAQVDADTMAYLLKEQEDMQVVNVDPVHLAAVLKRTIQNEQDPQAEHYLYVMDPVGNIMLYFTPENDAEQILKDIDKLLDHSSLG